MEPVVHQHPPHGSVTDGAAAAKQQVGSGDTDGEAAGDGRQADYRGWLCMPGAVMCLPIVSMIRRASSFPC